MIRRHTRRAAALLASVVATSAPPASPLPPGERLSGYLAIADRFRAGDTAPAVDELLRWRLADLRSVVAEVGRRRETISPRRGEPGSIDLVTVEAAVLLHAQVAVGTPGPVDDVQREHLRLAEQLLVIVDDAETRFAPASFAAGRGRPVRRVTGREFHAAVSGLLLVKGEADLAIQTAERGLDAAPDDPELLLAAACAHEQLSQAAGQLLGAPFLRPLSGVDTLLRDRAEWRPHVLRLDEERRLAVQLLRDALRAGPDLAAPRLRLARLLAQEGRADEALPQLRFVVERGSDDERYLAELFLAGLAEDRGDLAAAESHYRRALDAVPQSQAGRLGLAHVLGLTGRGASGRTLALETLSAAWPRAITADPWWLYAFGSARESERIFRAMIERLKGT